MNSANSSIPEWITAKIAAGQFLDIDTGRLARKLTTMIKLSDSMLPHNGSEDTESVVREFVDKVCWPT